MWGSLLSCGRLPIGLRRLPTAAQDNILPHILLLILFATGLFGQATVRTVPNLPSYKDLKFPPLKEVKIPEPETFTLPNGLKCFLLENHELPLVSGVALIRTGNLFDPADKRGLASITGMVLRTGGTKSKTGDEIDRELENVAASVESSIGESSGTVGFSSLAENTSAVMSVWRDILEQPEFRQDKLDLAKTQMRSAIARRNDEPSEVASREFSSVVYGRNTPFGWEVEYSDIDNIHRQDAVSFYQRYFFPANIMIGVYGDFKTEDMKRALTDLFASWTYTQQPVPKFPSVIAKAEPGIYLAEKPDVAQTFFEIGHLGGLLRDKDYAALEVAAQILGSGFTSRLVRKVRTELGYAYNIGANWGAGFENPGLFEISGSTKSKSTADTIRVILDELKKLRTGEVTPEELKDAQDSVLNSFVFNFDRPSKTLNRLLLYEYFGYPKDFIFQYQTAVKNVTRADVLRVSRDYFKPENLSIVAVGNPAEFGNPLTTLELPLHKIDLTIPEPPKPAGTGAAHEPQGAESKR
jgi:zinc protease